MKRHHASVIVASLFGWLMGSGEPVFAECVNTVSVDAVTNCWYHAGSFQTAGVPRLLDAGSWVITVAADPNPPPPGGYNHDAYSPWNSDSGNPDGSGRAWEWALYVFHEDGSPLLTGWSPDGPQYYATQQAALAANLGGSTIVHLEDPATVYFSISDLPCSDNRGGITVSVCRLEAPIPTVSEWGLVILALLLLTVCKIKFTGRRVASV